MEPSTTANTTYNSKSQIPDVYGFLLWIFIRVGTVFYLMWAFIPDSFWHSHGITYYPNRLWSISIPVYMCVTFWCLVIGYVGYCYHQTIEWDSSNAFSDAFAECPIIAHEADIQQMMDTLKMLNEQNMKSKNIHSCEEKYDERDSNDAIIPPIPNSCDLDIHFVNHVLFDNLDVDEYGNISSVN